MENRCIFLLCVCVCVIVLAECIRSIAMVHCAFTSPDKNPLTLVADAALLDASVVVRLADVLAEVSYPKA